MKSHSRGFVERMLYSGGESWWLMKWILDSHFVLFFFLSFADCFFLFTGNCQRHFKKCFKPAQTNWVSRAGNWILESTERGVDESRWAANLVFVFSLMHTRQTTHAHTHTHTHTHTHIQWQCVCTGFPNSGWTTLSVTPDVSRKNLLQAPHLFDSRVMAELQYTHTHTHTHTHAHLIHKVGQLQTPVRREQCEGEQQQCLRSSSEV